MISFPIPSGDTDTYDSLYYNGIPYSKILHDLRHKGGNHCHVDLDLDLSRRAKEIDGWFPAFGQRDAAASYLKNLGVAPGDIFLFFGNFHFVECKNGEYKYSRECGNFYREKRYSGDLGLPTGGEILSAPEKQKKRGGTPIQPMSGQAAQRMLYSRPLRGFLSISPSPERVCCPFDKKRVLTLEGATKATWAMNEVYDTQHIYGKRKNGAKDPIKGLYYAGIWQELD